MKIDGNAVLSIFLVTLLSACGGGSGPALIVDNGSGSGSEAQLSVSVLNSYRSGLMVCSDVNKDKQCNEGENSAITGENGVAKLGAAASDHSILAVLPSDIWHVDGTTGAQSFITKFTLSAPAGYSFVSPLTTLMNDASLSASNIGSAWGFDAQELLKDYEHQVQPAELQVGYVNQALSRFLLQQIQYQRPLSQYVDLLVPVMAEVSDAISDNKDLAGLRFILDQSGVVTTNLVSELITQVNYAVMAGNWNYYFVADTAYNYNNYSKFGIATVKSTELCLKTVELRGTSTVEDERFENCRMFGFNENKAFIGAGSSIDNMTLVLGERSEKGVVLVFEVTDHQGKVKGHYWMDNFAQAYNVGSSFTESQWAEGAFYKHGYETAPTASADRGQGKYKTQYFLGGEYVLTESNQETSYVSQMRDQHGFQSGLTVTGGVISYELSSGWANYVMVTRQAKRIALGVDAGRGVEFSLLTTDQELHSKLTNGELYSQ